MTERAGRKSALAHTQDLLLREALVPHIEERAWSCSRPELREKLLPRMLAITSSLAIESISMLGRIMVNLMETPARRETQDIAYGRKKKKKKKVSVTVRGGERERNRELIQG